MKQALIELHYLPSIQYYCKLVQYASIGIEQHENYNKGSYRNRTHIAGPNGLHRLSIPLEKGKNQKQNIQEVRIAYREHWQSQHWHSIQTAYGNAPFFEFYEEDIKAIYKEKQTFLFEWNWIILNTINELIGIAPKLEKTTDYEKTPSADCRDLRNTISPKLAQQSIDPNFKQAPYPQIFIEKTGFLPNLSILDLLFCTGPQTILYLENSIK